MGGKPLQGNFAQNHTTMLGNLCLFALIFTSADQDPNGPTEIYQKKIFAPIAGHKIFTTMHYDIMH